MNPTPELIDALYCDKVRAARELSEEERFLSGPRLFDWACEIAAAGIRAQHPGIDEQRVTQLLLERIDLARRLEQIP